MSAPNTVGSVCVKDELVNDKEYSCGCNECIKEKK